MRKAHPRRSFGLTNAPFAALAVSWLATTACGGVADGGGSERRGSSEALRISDPNDPEPILGCVSLSTGTLTASATNVTLGGSVTLSWHGKLPSGCAAIGLRLEGPTALATSGSLVITPQSSRTYSLTAVALTTGTTIFLSSVTVNVSLPSAITISASNQAPLLVQALGTPGEQITVQNNVDIDLSYLENIGVAAGVTLRGGRSSVNAGPRIRTTTRPHYFLELHGDNVRISGMRIEGPDMGIPTDDDGDAFGVVANSFVNVQIDNNELSGWTGAAVRIEDDYEHIDPFANPETVRVHDNYIHHNQHEGRLGYGVVVGNGAYALIDQNAFDSNRHAIAGDGSDGSGYHAYRNIVFKNGGLHRWIGVEGIGAWTHTHQFDMHGQDNCGVGAFFESVGSAIDLTDDPSVFNCGTAGHDMDIRYNTFAYSSGPAIKLRGTPQHAVFVGNNVFADDDLGNAVQQTESGLYLENDNQAGYDGTGAVSLCDFDGDGKKDWFMATGATWWFTMANVSHWIYLNTSTKRINEVTLGNFDSDPRCDVKADGVVYSGGRPPMFRSPVVGTVVTGTFQSL